MVSAKMIAKIRQRTLLAFAAPACGARLVLPGRHADGASLARLIAAEGVTVAHGAYVANMCISCHGAGLSGGKIPGAPPDWAPAANLTPGDGSAMARYKDAGQFVAMLRSGKRPDGAVVTVMPFESLRELNDVDAQALYAYLKTVPARPFGQR